MTTNISRDYSEINLFAKINKDSSIPRSYSEVNLFAGMNSSSSSAQAQIRSVKYLMEGYALCWSSINLDYGEIPFKNDEFRLLVNCVIENFKSKNLPEKFEGYIEKKDLPAGTQIFVRADLHGDLRSLVENIQSLQKIGNLDENFKCKPNFELVFLGDYVDRGNYSLEILALILSLKLENPNQVTIIRGNHEETSLNLRYCGNEDKHFYSFLHNRPDELLLIDLYKSFPLSMYISQEGENREYVDFTHGLFPLYVIPTELIDQNNASAWMVVPFKANRAEVMQKLKEIQKIDDSEFLQLKKELKKNKSKELVQKLKLYNAVEKIKDLIYGDHSFQPNDDSLTPYFWGDMASKCSSLEDLGSRDWKLAPIDIYSHLYLSRGQHAKIKMIIRGHEHQKRHFTYKYKLIVTTLTVGADSTYARNIDQEDTAYLLTIAPKVKNWTKQGLFRESGGEAKDITQAYPIRSLEI